MVAEESSNDESTENPESQLYNTNSNSDVEFCLGLTKNGIRCKKKVKKSIRNNGFCPIH